MISLVCHFLYLHVLDATYLYANQIVLFFNILILTFLLYTALWGPIQITLSIIYTHFHGHNKLETQL